MYLHKFTLKNIKSFAEVEMDFSNRGAAQLGTALVGADDLGKTTLLQAMAAALAGPGAARELMPVAEGWVRQGQPYGEIEAGLMLTEGDKLNPRLPKKTTPYTARFLVSGDDPSGLPAAWLQDPAMPTVPAIVEWEGNGPRKDRERTAEDMSRLKRTAYAEGKSGWFASGYGPYQPSYGSSSEAGRIQVSGRKSARFVTLFRRDAALTSADRWLVHLHNLARGGDAAGARVLNLVGNTLGGGLLGRPATLLVSERRAALAFDGEAPMPIVDLEAGQYRPFTFWLDLVRGLTAAFPDSAAPQEQRGVVLIDDLDDYFGRGRQREIGLWLRWQFPRLQFIVTTHQPFPAQLAHLWTNVLLDPQPRSLPDRPSLPARAARAAIESKPEIACVLS